jgi:hypothetical protein
MAPRKRSSRLLMGSSSARSPLAARAWRTNGRPYSECSATPRTTAAAPRRCCGTLGTRQKRIAADVMGAAQCPLSRKNDHKAAALACLTSLGIPNGSAVTAATAVRIAAFSWLIVRDSRPFRPCGPGCDGISDRDLVVLGCRHETSATSALDGLRSRYMLDGEPRRVPVGGDEAAASQRGASRGLVG